MFISLGKTDIGLKRQVNQDYFSIGTIYDASWTIVCDGLGGEKAGDIASKIATKVIEHHIVNNYQTGMNSSEIKNMLSMSFNLANSKIFDMARENKNYERMATTAIISFVVGYSLYVAHVGDSRIYIIEDENIIQLTKDDSLVQVLVEKGTLSKDEAKKHPQRNYLIKAIGIKKEIDVNCQNINIKPDNLILMCTDGLYNYADENIIKEMVDEISPNDLPDRFIELALNNGGCDNITAVVMFDPDYRGKGSVNGNG